jgi:2-amino-4-hydroxy-6-hydroxymethyldihydropteridine diphosphokinase
MNDVYLSLGSNIEPIAHLKAAVELLREKLEVVAVSPVYETAPMGYTEQANFLNVAVHIRTAFSPEAVKTILLEIEQALGRVRDPQNKNAPRTIDLDIALWNDEKFNYGERPWHVPDPDILRFIHIARPLADIAPYYLHPETEQTLESIAEGLAAEGLVQRGDLLSLR